ncbi:flavodoxin short chain [Clostridium tetanomorphum]|uniref:Flavodoxin n=1 Tax=Clostridium tetanomorphum TaxID=1553 RepID=A0A923EBY0_CLOTT|nr:flavodoxin [Clostridium tetanomorphum]KAJ53480.1 flavodoxin [Clostridium tetanomorphum DSM 665]MBC2398446.1 flavodoxin [Clostridium tetanomorphum]MBP1865289.1 flavodoxin short chain [Clostridium tetanomorphum]NRS85212.1 flavodoxin short chain [Clostridium tetanomorphum]NRZ98391.1 flavodoxin short chain [Clostridium tetanomorphum]
MKKVVIVYWSNGGNVEVLANNIGEGAKEEGAEVILKYVQAADVDEIMKADAVAFGSPSMDNNQVEQKEMAPFLKKFKELPVQKKPLVLFGSYGWDNGEFMEEWEKQMVEYDFKIVGKLVVQEAPDNKQIEKAKELGRLLAK